MPAITDFIKENVRGAGLVNLLSIPGYAKEYREAESKLKAIVKIMSDWFFWTLKILQPLRQFAIGGAVILGFKALGDAIANVVRQTGSLEAALRRLQSIQAAQRGLAPFLGGPGAARQRVAELTVMAGRGPFKFEEIAEANKQLEIFTRGAYSSAQATQKIGQAAIATGNQIGQVAGAVGDFYQNLREGRPIASSAENLRQLGIISQQTANQLVAMQETSASTAEIFGRLSTEIDHTAASMNDMGDSVETVNAEYQKAQENLRVQFGAPWTANDIQNTKNMTAAMNAIAPVVRKVSEEWAQLFGGFATVRTEIVKFAATNSTVRAAVTGLITTLNSFLAILLTVATVGLPLLIPRLNEILVTISSKLLGANNTVRLFGSTWGTVIKGLTATGVIGVAAIGVVQLTGAILNMVHAHREAGRELDRQKAAFDKANTAIKEQILNAKTLAEAQDAVAAAMNQAVDAYSNVVDVQTKLNAVTKDYWANALDPLAIPKLILQLKELDAAQARSLDILQEARQTFQRAVTERGTLTGPALLAYQEQLRQRRFLEEERASRRAEAIAPGRRPELERERGRELIRRAQIGETSALERATIEHQTAELQKQRAAHEFNAESAKKLLEVSKLMPGVSKDTIVGLEKTAKVEQDGADQAQAQMLQRQVNAKKGTAVQIEGELRRNQLALEAGAELAAGDTERGRQLFIQAGGVAAITDEERQRLQTENILLQSALNTAKAFEDQRNNLRDQGETLIDNADLLEREQKITRQTSDLELARRKAQRLGLTDLERAVENQQAFMERFDRYRRTLPDVEARQRALKETAEDIFTRETIPGGLPPVASSLARLGLGGGVYMPGGDPAVQIQKQLVTLARSSNKYLQIISGQGEGVE